MLSVCRGRTVNGRQCDWCVSFTEGRTLCRRWWKWSTAAGCLSRRITRRRPTNQWASTALFH